jgi:hypothetical protein
MRYYSQLYNYIAEAGALRAINIALPLCAVQLPMNRLIVTTPPVFWIQAPFKLLPPDKFPVTVS